ncbi:MAG: hypothetical protein M3R66_13335, partial [Actinomycetota bacterium]|nr:hypothetical protein [Actinomycetota bacterium]
MTYRVRFRDLARDLVDRGQATTRSESVAVLPPLAPEPHVRLPRHVLVARAVRVPRDRIREWFRLVPVAQPRPAVAGVRLVP